MFSCLKALIDSGDGGKRFRRKEKSYLWFQIIKDYMKNSTEEYIFEFALSQYQEEYD